MYNMKKIFFLGEEVWKCMDCVSNLSENQWALEQGSHINGR